MLWYEDDHPLPNERLQQLKTIIGLWDDEYFRREGHAKFAAEIVNAFKSPKEGDIKHTEQVENVLMLLKAIRLLGDEGMSALSSVEIPFEMDSRTTSPRYHLSSYHLVRSPERARIIYALLETLREKTQCFHGRSISLAAASTVSRLVRHSNGHRLIN